MPANLARGRGSCARLDLCGVPLPLPGLRTCCRGDNSIQAHHRTYFFLALPFVVVFLVAVRGPRVPVPERLPIALTMACACLVVKA